MNWEFVADCGTPDIQKMTGIMGSVNIAPDGRITLLTAALPGPFKELARSHYQVMLLSQEYRTQGIEPGLDQLAGLELLMPPPAAEVLRSLPDFSWMITFELQLLKPYLSRDDAPYYIIDNPVRKEKVFKVPMVAPSQWKGALRSAMVRSLANEPALTAEEFTACRFRLGLLFGDEKGEEEGANVGCAEFLDKLQPQATRQIYETKLKQHFSTAGQAATLPHHAGRLRFYPSYFDKIGLEIINPHDREKKVGKNPTLFECVPTGATARFSVLYLPLDLMGRGPEVTSSQSAADLRLLAQGLEDMLSLYGFGAKTSSGYGLAACKAGLLSAKVQANLLPGRTGSLAAPALPKVVHDFLRLFPNENFSEKPKQWRKERNTSAGNQERYAVARQAHRDYLEAVEHYEIALDERERSLAESAVPITEVPFENFTELHANIDELTSGWSG